MPEDLSAVVEAAMARVDALAVELAEQARIAVVADDELRRGILGASTGMPKARDRIQASLHRIDPVFEPTW